jgi:peptide-methionine (R)-S-oxide reductase
MIRIKLTFVTLALIQACHALAQLNIAALHSQRLPAAYSPSSTNTLVASRLSRRKAASSRNPLRATEDDSDVVVVVEGGGGMRTWNPFALAVLKLKLTEPAWTSTLNYKKASGVYLCANCGSPLFSSSGKYDSGTGWPSFWKTIESDRVALEREWDGRIECKCASCGGHLGHVFPDGPTRGSLDAKELETVPDTDPKIGYKVQGSAGDEESKYSRMPRFCLNGVAMRFEEDKR